MSYLDKTGLSHFFEKLKGVFAAKNHTHTKADIGLGNVDNVKQLPIAGGTMTGTLTLKGSQYNDANIYGVNSIYTADASDNASEGIHFYRDATHVDTLWMNGGDLLFTPNRALAGSSASTSKANSEKVARLPATVTNNQFVLTDGTTGKLKTKALTSQDIARPTGLRGFNDPTLQTLVSKVRANRLAFLPGDQIIIEKTTDGGATWVDAGVSDGAKSQIFSDASTGGVGLPLIDGFRNLKCGLRITITAMKYNVPAGTPETEKYNYWNVDHLPASGYQERYCTLKDFYFYITSSADSMGIKIERSSGKADHTWEAVFDDSSFYMTGWSGVDYVRIPQSTFGGGASKTGNYWNYRFTFMTKGKDGTTTMGGSATQAQTIYQINAYGDNVWAPSLATNPLMVHDHMYSFDRLKNVTFPAKVTATDFSGKFNGHTINADVPSGAKFTDTTYTAATAAPGKVASASAQGTSTNYARQDHTHGIDVGTGDANGQVKIAGQNASVKGLAALAYKASLAEVDIPTISIDGKTSGTLPVSRGGTGKTTAKDAANDFMNALDTGSSTPADADYYISQYVNGGNTTKTYHRRPMSALWTYIKGKIQAWAKNLTAKGNLGWTDQTAGKIPVTNNTLAYWDGRYNASASNLTYCAKGTFGNLAVKDSLTASDIPELNASKITAGTFSAARLPVATEDANGIVNNTYIRKMNELWSVHEAATVNNSVVSGSFATYINVSTTWQQDSYTNYWFTKISIPTLKRGAEVIVKYEDCQFLYLLDPPSEGWLEAMDGELWIYAKTQPTFSGAVDHVRISGYFINHTAIDSGMYTPPFKMELIWENENQEITFLPQTLNLDMHAYDMALVETQALPSSNEMGITYETGIISKGVASAIMGVAKNSNRTGLRKFTMTDAGIDVGEGIYNGGTHNDYFIPSRIYGIRGFGVFDVEPVWETLLEEGEENNALFPNQFSASSQLNGYPVGAYGWGTYDGNTGWMIHTRPQSDSYAYLYSNDKIDVTNYSYIVVDCYFYCYGGAAYVGLTQQNAPAGNSPANVMSVYAHPVDTRTKYRGEVRLNVKDLTGEYCLVIACAGSGNSNYEGHSMIISAKAR